MFYQDEIRVEPVEGSVSEGDLYFCFDDESRNYICRISLVDSLVLLKFYRELGESSGVLNVNGEMYFFVRSVGKRRDCRFVEDLGDIYALGEEIILAVDYYESSHALMKYVAWRYKLDVKIWGKPDWKPKKFVFGEIRKDVELVDF